MQAYLGLSLTIIAFIVVGKLISLAIAALFKN